MTAATREALDRGEPLLGTFVKSQDPMVAEILARAGFDFLIADLEHSVLTIADVASIARAAEASGVAVIARISPRELTHAGRLLETGAIGIQLTDVSDAETLAELARVTSFPPEGSRSLALSHRGAAFGGIAPDRYLREAAAELVTVAQIESRAGVAALPDLLRSPHRPHVWFIGPLDLSNDLGHPGDYEHPDVRGTIEAVLARLRDAGVPIGVFARSGAEAASWRAQGVQLIAIGSDVTLLGAAAREALAAAGGA